MKILFKKQWEIKRFLDEQKLREVIASRNWQSGLNIMIQLYTIYKKPKNIELPFT